MHSVGADDCVGLSAGAIGECHDHTIAVRFQADEAFFEMNTFCRNQIGQRRMKLSPMQT